MTPPLIVAHSLCKSYGKNSSCRQILRNVDISIEAPKFVTITGPSGCGKSTLLSILGLLQKPTSGQLKISGRDCSSMSMTQRARVRRSLMGFIFQDFALLPGFSAFENAALPLKYDGHQKSYIKKRMEQLLRQFGIFDRAGSYPQEMSGGEQQRVAIARAMARSPRILLADEPTGNLDEENARFVFNTLRALTDNDGVTVIVVTHDRQLAMMADTRIELERIIKSGVS